MTGTVGDKISTPSTPCLSNSRNRFQLSKHSPPRSNVGRHTKQDTRTDVSPPLCDGAPTDPVSAPWFIPRLTLTSGHMSGGYVWGRRSSPGLGGFPRSAKVTHLVIVTWTPSSRCRRRRTGQNPKSKAPPSGLVLLLHDPHPSTVLCDRRPPPRGEGPHPSGPPSLFPRRPTPGGRRHGTTGWGAEHRSWVYTTLWEWAYLSLKSPDRKPVVSRICAIFRTTVTGFKYTRTLQNICGPDSSCMTVGDTRKNLFSDT